MTDNIEQTRDAFPELRALTEALLTRADDDYLRRQINAAVAVMAGRGCLPPVPWPDEDFGIAVWGRVSRLALRDWEMTCDDCCGTGKVDHSEPLHVDGRYMGEDLFRIPCDTCLSTGVLVCIADIPKEIHK